MKTVLYPGSFDPVTAGHMDIITRAAQRFERVVVAVLFNPQKAGAFPLERRLALLRRATEHVQGVEVRSFPGLLAEAAADLGVDGVLRGLRGAADVESELQMARLNRLLGGVETVFLAAAPEVSHISASAVREIGRFGGSLRGLVPGCVEEEIQGFLRDNR